MPSSVRVFVAPRPVRGSIYLGDSAFKVLVDLRLARQGATLDLVLVCSGPVTPSPIVVAVHKVPSVGRVPIPLEERPPPSGPSRIETAAVLGGHSVPPLGVCAPPGSSLGLPRLLGSGAACPRAQ
eukprot:gene11397-biopygen7808